jgi:outer membrane protein assembly factor BamB
MWRRDLGAFVSQHGGAASPTLFEDRVIVFVDTDSKGGSGSFLIALDANSGETLWKTEHESSVTNYSTPLIYEPDPNQPPQVIINSLAQGMTAYNPENGKLLWQLKEVNGQPLLNLRSVSSPYLAGELLIASCGVGGGGNSLVAVRPPARPGDTAEMVYRIARSAPYVPTSIAKDGLLFLFDDAGVASCFDAKTGEQHWRQRLGGGFFSSPVCVDDRLICVSTAGEVVLLAAADEFKELGRVDLGETCHATPAIANGRLYLRTYRHLYSLGGSK